MVSWHRRDDDRGDAGQGAWSNDPPESQEPVPAPGGTRQAGGDPPGASQLGAEILPEAWDLAALQAFSGDYPGETLGPVTPARPEVGAVTEGAFSLPSPRWADNLPPVPTIGGTGSTSDLFTELMASIFPEAPSAGAGLEAPSAGAGPEDGSGPRPATGLPIPAAVDDRPTVAMWNEQFSDNWLSHAIPIDVGALDVGPVDMGPVDAGSVTAEARSNLPIEAAANDDESLAQAVPEPDRRRASGPLPAGWVVSSGYRPLERRFSTRSLTAAAIVVVVAGVVGGIAFAGGGGSKQTNDHPVAVAGVKSATTTTATTTDVGGTAPPETGVIAAGLAPTGPGPAPAPMASDVGTGQDRAVRLASASDPRAPSQPAAPGPAVTTPPTTAQPAPVPPTTPTPSTQPPTTGPRPPPPPTTSSVPRTFPSIPTITRPTPPTTAPRTTTTRPHRPPPSV